MTIDARTGEVIEFDRGAAERRAERITLRLDAIAENFHSVLPMIREAIGKRDDLALGYRSPGEYVADRFGQSLAGLGIEVRRAVVGELTQAGLSTRAIAPVVGVDQKTVVRDVQQVRHVPHLSETPEGGATDAVTQQAAVEAAPSVPRLPVTGIDGKTYTRPEPTLRSVPLRTPEQQNAEEFAVRFAGQMLSLQSLEHPHMRTAAITKWQVGQSAVSPVQRPYASPDHIRAVAHGLLALADEWEQDRD